MPEQRTADLFTADGSSQGRVDLDPEIFGIEPNVPVMHQVVTAQLAAARSGSASTLTRSEVRGGGAKPWRQKGLGRARHGSIRSPQWAGGGVAHGPKPRSYVQRTPKKMKRLALYSALSVRAAADAVKVVSAFDWDAPKTKTARGLLAAMGLDGKVLVVTRYGDEIAEKSFRNLPEARILDAGQLNTYDVLWSDAVIFAREALPSTGAAQAPGAAEQATNGEEEE